MAGTRESLADTLHAEAARLEREVQAARGGQATAQQVLADALAALPEGGNAAAGARLGKLQAEADTLTLEIRAARARQRELEARVRELAVELGQAQPDAARVQALEQQLRAAQAELGRTAAAAADVAAKPGTAADIEAAKAESARAQQEVEALSRTLAQAQNELAEAGARHAGLVARHASAQEELANLGRVAQENARRERQLRRLVEEARGELVRLEGENEQIQQLNRAVTAADARLHDAESALARHAEALGTHARAAAVAVRAECRPGQSAPGQRLAGLAAVAARAGGRGGVRIRAAARGRVQRAQRQEPGAACRRVAGEGAGGTAGVARSDERSGGKLAPRRPGAAGAAHRGGLCRVSARGLNGRRNAGENEVIKPPEPTAGLNELIGANRARITGMKEVSRLSDVEFEAHRVVHPLTRNKATLAQFNELLQQLSAQREGGNFVVGVSGLVRGAGASYVAMNLRRGAGRRITGARRCWSSATRIRPH